MTEPKLCAYCNNIITDPKRTKYCSAECYRLFYNKNNYNKKITHNKRALNKFSILMNRRKGQTICDECPKKLSSYNKFRLCNSCRTKKHMTESGRPRLEI